MSPGGMPNFADLEPFGDPVAQSKINDAIPGNTAYVTYRGRSFDIFNPDTWVFDIDDIAQALSNICRFGGHVNFYSVAEHSVRVADWLGAQGYPVRIQLIGLLHDAIEAYIGDIVRPIKRTFTAGGETILDVERTLEYAFFRAYGLLDENSGDQFEYEWKIVKQGDMAIYSEEREERPNVGENLFPPLAKAKWLLRYHQLSDAMSQEWN